MAASAVAKLERSWKAVCYEGLVRIRGTRLVCGDRATDRNGLSPLHSEHHHGRLAALARTSFPSPRIK